jgi:hypothetical protein
MGDLRMNTARGLLVEYLIAVTVDSTAPFRIEWAGHDVTAADGTRIEAKSAAYLQSWAQKRPSTPRFNWSGANGKIRHPQLGNEVLPANGRADVWIFALHTCQDRPLDRVIGHSGSSLTGASPAAAKSQEGWPICAS